MANTPFVVASTPTASPGRIDTGQRPAVGPLVIVAKFAGAVAGLNEARSLRTRDKISARIELRERQKEDADLGGFARLGTGKGLIADVLTGIFSEGKFGFVTALVQAHYESFIGFKEAELKALKNSLADLDDANDISVNTYAAPLVDPAGSGFTCDI